MQVAGLEVSERVKYKNKIRALGEKEAFSLQGLVICTSQEITDTHLKRFHVLLINNLKNKKHITKEVSCQVIATHQKERSTYHSNTVAIHTIASLHNHRCIKPLTICSQNMSHNHPFIFLARTIPSSPNCIYAYM
jgi:hypothetical protein